MLHLTQKNQDLIFALVFILKKQSWGYSNKTAIELFLTIETDDFKVASTFQCAVFVLALTLFYLLLQMFCSPLWRSKEMECFRYWQEGIAPLASWKAFIILHLWWNLIRYEHKSVTVMWLSMDCCSLLLALKRVTLSAHFLHCYAIEIGKTVIIYLQRMCWEL